VRSLAGNVFHATGTSHHAVSLQLAIDEVPLSLERAIPCGLVVNELITNALKHGFKDGRTGTIRVELRPHGDCELSLTVQDDGVGLPAGFDVERVESMGLRLVSTLSEQLDARLVIRGDHGASFQLLFPASANARRSASRTA
jgi:two-component sensor histidine kinase